VVANQLYRKVDDENRSFFEAQQLGPFIYEMKGKPVELSYHLAPEAMLDERELAAVWARRSWDAALRAQATKILQTQRAKARRRPNATS